MADRKIRDIGVDATTKARLENAAWKQRSSVSDLVRAIADNAINGDYDTIPNATIETGERARVGVVMPDDQWEKFGDTAWRLHTSRGKLVQSAAAHLYGDIPIDRSEVTR